MPIPVAPILDLMSDVGKRLEFMRGKVEAVSKDDGSPVTEADKMANHAIVAGLSRLMPGIPIISEEQIPENSAAIVKSDRYLVIDPLDGTRTYLDGYDGYGIHIALIEKGVPVAGFVHFPARASFYFTGDDGAAYCRQGRGVAAKIAAPAAIGSDGLRACVSWRAGIVPAKIAGQAFTPFPEVGGGRLCRVAEGLADIAWMAEAGRTHVFSYWDVAAGDAVLRAAGGIMVDMEGKAITYRDPVMAIPNAVAGHPAILHDLGLVMPENPDAIHSRVTTRGIHAPH